MLGRITYRRQSLRLKSYPATGPYAEIRLKEPIPLPLPAILHGVCRYFCVTSYQRVKYWCEVTPCTPYMLCLLIYLQYFGMHNHALYYT